VPWARCIRCTGALCDGQASVLRSELLQSDHRRDGEGALPARVTSIDPHWLAFMDRTARRWAWGRSKRIYPRSPRAQGWLVPSATGGWLSRQSTPPPSSRSMALRSAARTNAGLGEGFDKEVGASVCDAPRTAGRLAARRRPGLGVGTVFSVAMPDRAAEGSVSGLAATPGFARIAAGSTPASTSTARARTSPSIQSRSTDGGVLSSLTSIARNCRSRAPSFTRSPSGSGLSRLLSAHRVLSAECWHSLRPRTRHVGCAAAEVFSARGERRGRPPWTALGI